MTAMRNPIDQMHPPLAMVPPEGPAHQQAAHQPVVQQQGAQQQGAQQPAADAGVAIEFAVAMPGFAGEKSFTLTLINEQSLLFALRSVQTPELRFILVSPGRFFPDYAPDIHENDVVQLGLADNDEVQLFVIVTVRDSIADATANLLAPIVIVPGRNLAMQIILSDDRLPLRAPLVTPAS